MRRFVINSTAVILAFSSCVTGTFFMPGIASAAVPKPIAEVASAPANAGFFLRPGGSRGQVTVTVRPHDSLASIAQRVLGNASWWPQVYWRNASKLGRSTVISPGEKLSFGVIRWAHRPHIPSFARVVSAPTHAGSPGGTSNPSPPSLGSSGGGGVGGAFGACVRMAENGGSYSWATGNGGGAYQFLESTWVGYGGSAAEFGSAAPAEQDRVFLNAINADGQGNWSSYDGCSAGLSTEAVGAVRVGGDLRAEISHPHHPHRFVPLRLLAFRKALTKRGDWYQWGGIGPSTFDCSGLVYWAYLAEHRPLGRTTYDMLADAHIHFTTHPRKGMLAFYGSGHVELYVRPGHTFGAHESGEKIGYVSYNSYWHPDRFAWVSRH
jgi:hypothetical protein